MSSRWMRLLGVSCLSLSLVITGCATIHSKSISDFAKGQGHRVAAAEVGHGILMLTVPELDSAARLRSECQGNLTGVQTTLMSRNWFGIVQIYEEKSEGWCL